MKIAFMRAQQTSERKFITLRRLLGHHTRNYFLQKRIQFAKNCISEGPAGVFAQVYSAQTPAGPSKMNFLPRFFTGTWIR